MPITPCAGRPFSRGRFRSRWLGSSRPGVAPELETFARLDALTPACATLFTAAAQESVFFGLDWYRTVLDHALPAGAEPCFTAFPSVEAPLALFPLQILRDGRLLQSLTTPYTCLFRPLVAAATGVGVLRQAGAALGRFCRAWPVVRLDALPADWPRLEPLLAGARAAGLLVLHFDHFGNWHEAVQDLSWQDYVEARPGALRATIHRKMRRCEREALLQIVDSPGAALEQAIVDFESIYRHSWKNPEPFPRFNPALMRAMATPGVLRLGLLRVQGKPVASQFWIVERGRATMLKLAHDEAYRPLSPGTVLTALMIRHLLDQEHVAELDFGRGDDAYKRLWVGYRRQRIGVMLANPCRLQGLAVLSRHWLGRSTLQWLRLRSKRYQGKPHRHGLGISASPDQ
jgi:CelD/BcsL family acetyltransferase involved in cellulose biosynthesis